MEIAKITSKGQVTIPAEIRKKLNLKKGDKIVFVEEDGNIIIANSTMIVLKQTQKDFAGEAEKAGLHSADDVVSMIKTMKKSEKS